MIESLTVGEQLILFGAAYRLPARELERRSAELLETFNCTKYARTRISRLSGGTRQKANLIASLLHSPDVLVLDEPYQGFDYETYLTFWDFTERFRDSGRSVVVVSHMHSEKERFDAMIDLVDGRARVTGRAAAGVAGAAR